MKKTLAFCLLFFALPAWAQIVVDVHLQITNLANDPISTAVVGETVKLRVSVEDVRPKPLGVFAAYLDISYSTSLVSPVLGLEHFAPYLLGTNGEAVAGLIDEGGGFSNVFSELGGGRFTLFEQSFEVLAAGLIEFQSSPADELPAHDILIYGSDDPVGPGQVSYGSASFNAEPLGPEIFQDGFELGAGE